MKKLILFFALILLMISLVTAELDDSDLKKIEAVVRREVQSSNDKLRDDLKGDIDSVKTEVDKVLEDISGSSSTTKTILALSVAGIVIIAETFISFLKFLVWRLKRKLKPKVIEPVKKLKLHQPEKKPVEKLEKPEIKKLKLRKPETKLEKERRKLHKLREKIKKKQDMKKLKDEMRKLKKSG